MNSFKEAYPGAPVLYVDAGNFSALGIPSSDIRNEGMIEGLNRIGYAAVMVGERELAKGYEAFEEMRKKAEFPFVSANFVFEDTQEPVVAPYVIQEVEHAGKKIRVGIMGLNRYNTAFLKGTKEGRNIVVASPFDTAKKTIPKIRSEADMVVLLTSLSISQSRQLARELQGLDLIVGASGGVVSVKNARSGGVPIVFPGNQGKYMAEIRAFVADGGITTTQNQHYLNRDYPSEPELQKLIETVLTQENDINRQRASANVPRPVLPAGMPHYAGAEACIGCHEPEADVWKDSTHAHAFHALVAANQDFNEECVGCHVVGFGRKAGFINAKATPELIDVQCESCHGPGSLHVETPGAGYGAAGARSCLGCHDPENSPEFDFYTYWPKIKH